jgi:hypothetical protein
MLYGTSEKIKKEDKTKKAKENTDIKNNKYKNTRPSG